MIDPTGFLLQRRNVELAWVILTIGYSSFGILMWVKSRIQKTPLDWWGKWRSIFGFSFLMAMIGSMAAVGKVGLVSVGLIGTFVWVPAVLFRSFSVSGAKENWLWILAILIAFVFTLVEPDRRPRDPLGAAYRKLRTIATALEDYHSYFREYPTNLVHLTPPYDFLLSMPIDPYQHAMGKEFPEDLYKLRVSPDRQRFVLYSIGPDLRNNLATIPYSVTNGTQSFGDIIRWGEANHD